MDVRPFVNVRGGVCGGPGHGDMLPRVQGDRIRRYPNRGRPGAGRGTELEQVSVGIADIQQLPRRCTHASLWTKLCRDFRENEICR